MQNQVKTAGETAPAKTMVIYVDCHKKNNIVVKLENEYDEKFWRKHAKEIGFGFVIRDNRPKPVEPTCDNCDNMTIRHTGSGNHRHCDLMNLYIPDEEMFPVCSYHKAIEKFERKVTAFAKKGGAA